MDILKAQKLIRNAGMAGIVWCVIILVGLIQTPGFNGNLFTLILVLTFTIGIFAKSRVCAVLMFVLFIFTIGTAVVFYLIKFGFSGNFLYSLGALVFLVAFCYIFVKGIIGAFAYHYIRTENEGETAGRSNETAGIEGESTGIKEENKDI
jgi:predicted membrane protein